MAGPDRPQAIVDAVVIGRNEGPRLAACIASLSPQVRQVVYVDSGSTDGSAALARARGARVIDLDPGRPFTAARARNAGLAALPADGAFVQFVDGDCTVDPDWVATALAFLEARPDIAVACGRRRETHPEELVYNRLCDAEWDTPVGEAKQCGGDALMRRAALAAVGGYRDTLIAGEEPELCVRLRQSGWRIWRLPAEMTRHDARLLRFGQWWRRTRRAGHAFAEGAALHGAPPDRHWVREARRCLIWGAGIPAVALAGGLVTPWAPLLLLAYPLQFARLAARRPPPGVTRWQNGALNLLGKFAEAQGALGYHVGRLRGRRTGLIEYR